MQNLPKWDLTRIYPDMHSRELQQHLSRFTELQEALQSVCREKEKFTSAQWISTAIPQLEQLLDLHEQLEAYAYTTYSTDTQSTEALEGLTMVEQQSVALKALLVLFNNTLAYYAKADELQELLKQLPEQYHTYTYVLQELLIEQQHQMSAEEESLAAELERSGGDAWGRLQEAVSSTCSAVWDEETGEQKSVVELRACAFSPDSDVRERAYSKELAVWKQQETALAAALNGVKGSAITLCKRRRYESPLEQARMQSRISRKTLDTLLQVMEEALPSFRKYLKLKAKLLKRESLRFCDLFAPVAQSTAVWTFEAASHTIIELFSRFHPPMGSFAERAFKEGWVDAQPRRGKVGGAYCIHLPITGESRILCNFDGSFSSVSTVAHELGHAYHGELLKQIPALLREYPMTLAETASIFAETMLFDGALEQAPEEEKIGLIEHFLQESTQVIVDILSRFIFEKSLFAAREERELTPEELCTLMLSAQQQTYGEGLDPDWLHPYMWAVKGHYYHTNLAFYNYPYAFGQLFGLGLYARYKEQGSGFGTTYDNLLRLTGANSAETVAAEIGCDIENPDFWRAGIQLITSYIEIFEQLVENQS